MHLNRDLTKVDMVLRYCECKEEERRFELMLLCVYICLGALQKMGRR